MKLTYCIQKEKGYIPFLEYVAPDTINEDEIIARQLCDYFVVKGQEYALYSNEFEDEFEDVILLQEKGQVSVFSEEKVYTKEDGLCIELRLYQENGDMPLLKVIECEEYVNVIRYLLKHVVKLPGLGYYEVTSREVDEDRCVFVMYVERMEQKGRT